jgi:hypothetical protein
MAAEKVFAEADAAATEEEEEEEEVEDNSSTAGHVVCWQRPVVGTGRTSFFSPS